VSRGTPHLMFNTERLITPDMIQTLERRRCRSNYDHSEQRRR